MARETSRLSRKSFAIKVRERNTKKNILAVTMHFQKFQMKVLYAIIAGTSKWCIVDAHALLNGTVLLETKPNLSITVAMLVI